jgi:hypothetical protein
VFIPLPGKKNKKIKKNKITANFFIWKYK